MSGLAQPRRFEDGVVGCIHCLPRLERVKGALASLVGYAALDSLFARGQSMANKTKCGGLLVPGGIGASGSRSDRWLHAIARATQNALASAVIQSGDRVASWR